MLIINGHEFAGAGYNITAKNASLTVVWEGEFEALVNLVEEADNHFSIDGVEYTEYDVLSRVIKHIQAVNSYTIVLETTKSAEDALYEITGEESISYHEAIVLRGEIETIASALPDDEASHYVWAFPEWNGDGISYAIGDRVKYEATLYKCVIAHESQPNWNPVDAPSLWARTDDPHIEFPDWVQPTGAMDAYMIGDKVSHNEKHWISTADNNVWEPGVYGWDEVTEDA